MLPDENYENDIKRVLNRFYLVLAMLYILIIATFGPLFLLLLLPIYFPLKMLITKHKTRGLQSINSSFTISKYLLLLITSRWRIDAQKTRASQLHRYASKINMRIFVLLTLIALLFHCNAWSGDYMLTISDNPNAACTERARKIHEWCAEERAKGNECLYCK